MGYHFRTTTDTEVLLTAYIHWGLDCLNRFNGMWAFVLWDNGTQTLFASRDRFGIKPLYYHQAQGEWFFASEIKALLKHPKVPCEPDKQSVYHFMSITLYPPTEENTFFTGRKRLKNSQSELLTHSLDLIGFVHCGAWERGRKGVE